MTFHDEVDIEEMDWNDELHVFTYQYVVGASQVGSLSRAHQVLDPPSRHPTNSRLSPLVEPDRCPCGDLFQITPEELLDGEDIARCPSCSLYVVVVYELDDIPNYLAKLEVYDS